MFPLPLPSLTAVRSSASRRPLAESTNSAATERPAARLAVMAAVVVLAGCTSTHQWWHNGWKVGPNYGRPVADAADAWIDSEDDRVKTEPTDYSYWWTTFHDPTLDRLIDTAYRQNLPLQIAGLRVLEARAQRGIAAGNLFAQPQRVLGGYNRNKLSATEFPFGDFPIKRHYDLWNVGFDASWELDIWGRLRRGIESADANLDAQIENYDDVLVILQAEVAAAYIQMRTLEQRIELARQNIRIQQDSLAIIQQRFEAGVVGEIDVRQAKAVLAATESLIPTLQENHRKVQNGLCILMGVPPRDLTGELDSPGTIPVAPAEVVVGIPADLLRRRPDVRRAERQAAAQSARIGMATAELYPQFALSGTIALRSEELANLFDWHSLAGLVGPGIRWNILNYGRIRNGIRVEDARFQQAVVAYQNAVLLANKEVEDAIVSYLREQARVKSLQQAATETKRALELGLMQYSQGLIDYQRVLDSQRALVLQQDTLAESQGKVATNLVAVYKAVGGGWRMRYAAGQADSSPASNESPASASTADQPPQEP